MNTLTRLFGSSPAKVALVDTDDVYPLHMLDDTKTLQGIVVTWTLRFNDVLDADKLHAALAKLLEIGDWKKLGGRLRLNVRMPCLLAQHLTDPCRRMESWRVTSRSRLLRNALLCNTVTKS